ncbi:hypothetical protein RISK_003204 [Rhodopirellula islandica]|uniref:Uncharacterized protein n=1 Tax=Rhodopirellula islandica TaxID=595434 RepID=A0A0J1BEJ7_RHOIS|nr:hypothetical protein RISK_003204 [Rhodopirellula islandica]
MNSLGFQPKVHSVQITGPSRGATAVGRKCVPTCRRSAAWNRYGFTWGLGLKPEAVECHRSAVQMGKVWWMAPNGRTGQGAIFTGLPHFRPGWGNRP